MHFDILPDCLQSPRPIVKPSASLAEGTHIAINALNSIESRVNDQREKIDDLKKNLSNVALAMAALYSAAEALTSGVTEMDTGLESISEDVALSVVDVEQIGLTANRQRPFCNHGDPASRNTTIPSNFPHPPSIRDLPTWS
jgi:hypothetical protein